jgi:hypothetical protein
LKIRRTFRLPLAFFGILFLSVSMPSLTHAAASDQPIGSRTAEVDGIKLHYLTAGHGPAVILLHGYTQTSRMWRPIIPLLAEKFTVIAPDLPGIGDSEIPANGLDMKTAAIRIHALAKSLNIYKAVLSATISDSWSPMPTPRSSPRKPKSSWLWTHFCPA